MSLFESRPTLKKGVIKLFVGTSAINGMFDVIGGVIKSEASLGSVVKFEAHFCQVHLCLAAYDFVSSRISCRCF